MRPLSPSKPPQRPPLRFGSASGLTGVPGFVNTLFSTFQSNRGTEMLVEDVMGFGVGRTIMDLRRDSGNDGSLNIPAASERFFREITSILTDTVLGGVVAWGMGKLIFDRGNSAFSNTFMQYPSLELFQDIVKSGKLAHADNPEAGKKAFLDELLTRFEGHNCLDSDNTKKIRGILKNAWELKTTEQKGSKKGTSWFRQSPNAEHFNAQAAKLRKLLEAAPANFSWKLSSQDKKKVPFELNELLDDVNQFATHMGKAWKNKGAKPQGWRELAESVIQRTLTAKQWKIPVGLAIGMGATFAMPFLGTLFTRKLYGIDYFPGEKAPVKGQAQAGSAAKPGFIDRNFPYVKKAFKEGNFWPLIGSVLPLVAAVGFLKVDTLKLVNPFAKGVGKKLFDYTKGWPFTSPQQMASMFALLITSRLLCSRSDNEYKERLLDSAGGWFSWILLTPIIKKAVSNWINPLLLNADGSLKSTETLQHFAASAGSKAPLKAKVLIDAGSTVATMLVLGLGAPWAGIKWTQYNEKRKQEKLVETQAQQKQIQPQPFPSAGLPVFASPFAAMPSNAFAQPAQATNPYAWPQPMQRR